MADLFGRYCYIDTPWIAGKRTRYRIIGSGVRSNAWCEVPVTGRTELVHHNSQEDVVFVVLDTLVSDDSIIRRFAAKDIEVIEPPADVRPVVRGRWKQAGGKYSRHKTIDRRILTCSVCGNILYMEGVNAGRGDANFCPNCGSYNGGDISADE